MTVFGESGGAAKTYMVMAMPRCEGALPPGDCSRSTLVDMAVRGLPAADGIRNAERLLARLGIKSTQLEMLQTMPMDRLLRRSIAYRRRHPMTVR